MSFLLPLAFVIACGGEDDSADAGPSLQDVQALFGATCAGSVCHIDFTGEPAGELDLTASAACASLIGVPSVEDPAQLRVVPGNPAASYLICKLDSDCPTRDAATQIMPLGTAGPPQADLDRVRAWVSAKAPGCGGPDNAAPSFAGARAAIGLQSAIRIEWDAASDDSAAPEAIEYLVYAAEQSGGQSFDTPSAVTSPGATSHTMGALPISTTRFFVVRARDPLGNTDDNTVEVSATTSDTADETAPSFAGVAGVAAVSSTALDVTWVEASDDVTPARDIRYRVYVAGSSGGQDFGSPSVDSAPGQTQALITGLASETPYFVVVRAVDDAGNEDANTVERSETTGGLVSFSGQVQPILSNSCTSMRGCHGFPMPAEGLDLRSGVAYSNLVSVASGQCSGATLVVPSGPATSYLVEKITETAPCFGTLMPKVGSLSAGEIATITDWIAQGAPDN